MSLKKNRIKQVAGILLGVLMIAALFTGSAVALGDNDGSVSTTNNITATSDIVLRGGSVTILIQVPSGEWYVGVDKEAVIPRNQADMTGILDYDGNYITNQNTNTEDYSQARIHVGSSDIAQFNVKSYTGKNFKVMLFKDNNNQTVYQDITLTVIDNGGITATTEKDAVSIGDKFNISGTNDFGGDVIFFIKGTNYPLSFYGNHVTGEAYAVGSGNIWNATINTDTNNLSNPDAGAYTIYVAKVHWGYTGYSTTTNVDDFDNTSKFDAYTTTQVSLIQPLINITTIALADIYPDNILTIAGYATGSPNIILVYVIGTNYFAVASAPVSADGSYSFSKKIIETENSEPDAWSMDPGKYTVVVQHSMYDGVFNVAPISDNNGGYTLVLNESGNAFIGNQGILFNTSSRPISDAENILINAINSQNIDDMQAHVSFNVSKNTPSTPINASTSIRAKTDSSLVSIGDEFEISGTNELGGNVLFFIKGPNYPLSFYGDKSTGEAYDIGSGTDWAATIDTSKLSNPDMGEYTIYIAKVHDGYTGYPSTNKTSDLDIKSKFDAYNITTFTLTKPKITATISNGIFVQGDKLEITGSASGNPSRLKLYVFGTNFFEFDSVPILDDGTYLYTKKIVSADKSEANAWSMATGQYFLVIQHPMYDGVFNIGPIVSDWGYDIRLNEMGSYTDDGIIIFNTLQRQSSNAAQALVDAIGSSNIDDIQAHLSFIVAGPTSYVNTVPSQVVKGQALTLSGTTTGHKNEVVAVELLSTAFAAVPKETVGSEAFATMTTRIGDDGVWSVSFDTSNLNTGEYRVSIAVGQLDPVTAKTNIVQDGSSPATPTPVVTPTPIVTPTPGFTYDNTDYSVIPSESIVPGTKVSASMIVTYPEGSTFPNQLNLDSDLVGVSWTVVKNPGTANALTFHPTYPYDYISNFDIYESSGSVTLQVTVIGTVSSESAGTSIYPLILSESGGEGGVYKSPSLYVSGTGTIIPVTPTPTPKSTFDSSSNYSITPTVPFTSGTKVTASVSISYPEDSMFPNQLNLDSDLVGVSWTVVKTSDLSNTITFHPTYPYDYISNFDMYESSGSVNLFITVNGTVSSESSGKSIIPLTITESGGSGRFFIAPAQYVYSTGNITENLQTLNNSIMVIDSAISYYEENGYNCSVSQQYLDLARANYTVAVAAVTEDPQMAFSNYEDGMIYIARAEQSLAYVGLSMVLSYTVDIDEGIAALYAKGKNTEANLINSKNTEIKNNYSVYLGEYQAGNADIGSILTLSQTAVDVYDEMNEYLSESGSTASAKLSSGWNFISVPKKLSADYDTAAELFADVNMANHALLSYNAQTKSWEQLTGSSMISPLDAIWIYSESPVTLLYEFSTSPGAPAVKKVYEGWNAVGVSSDSAITAQAAFGNTDWYTYLCWNSAKQKFCTPIIKGSSGTYADTNYVYPWSGGWLYVNADGNYVGFTA